MTNIIGTILIVMSVQTNTIIATNDVSITCAEAGCTNTQYRAYYDSGHEVEDTNTLSCVYYHSRQEVAPAVEITETTIGACGAGGNVPLYVIRDQKVIGNKGVAGGKCYSDGIYIIRPEKTKKTK